MWALGFLFLTVGTAFAVTTVNFTGGIWNSSGNVGIGTTAPGYKLDVNGFSRLGSGTAIKPTNGGAWIYYPNVAGYGYDGTTSGAIIIHTNIARASNEMFKMRVIGYGYGSASNVDFTVVGYAYSGTTGSVDGLAGGIVNYSIVDNGNDGLSKRIGIDANGMVAIAVGDSTSSFYYYRLTTDFWTTRNSVDASTGWSVDVNAVSGFGWKDIKTLTPSIIANGTNIGIGTVTPGYKLDVSGAGNFTGTVNVGTPTAAGNAATQAYVDTAVSSGVSGTTNYIPKFTGTNAIGNSLLFDNVRMWVLGLRHPDTSLM